MGFPLETAQVFDVMTRLKVHHMAEGGTPQATIAAKCGISVRTVERVLAEPEPTREEVAENSRQGAKRPGRPAVTSDALIERIRTLLGEETIAATEVLRRARGWGFTGSRSTMAALVKELRPTPRKEAIVRFEGLPGEYTQFDFGEANVKYADGRKDKLVFWAARMKYSRMMHVIVVPDQRAETLARCLLASLAFFGGSTKEWVFDNPKTVRISPIGVEPPVLHAYLRDLVAEYRTIPTLCTPGKGQQKGSVERLVKYVKHSFFFARKFQNRADALEQLVGWLQMVNHERPSDATGVIPAVALEAEKPWLAERPVRVTADAWPIRETITVTPMGTVSFAGTPYFATATRIGAPATLFIRRDAIEIVVGDERVTHGRKDGIGVLQMLPSQTETLLGAVHGRRKQATVRREALLRIGKPAWAWMTALVHRHPEGRWERPCNDLYDLLREHGEDAMRAAFERCNLRCGYTVNDVAMALREVA